MLTHLNSLVNLSIVNYVQNYKPHDAIKHETENNLAYFTQNVRAGKLLLLWHIQYEIQTIILNVIAGRD